MFISCKQCYATSIGIGQVSAIFYLKSIGIRSAGENWYQCITSSYKYITVMLTVNSSSSAHFAFITHKCSFSCCSLFNCFFKRSIYKQIVIIQCKYKHTNTTSRSFTNEGSIIAFQYVSTSRLSISSFDRQNFIDHIYLTLF